MTLLDFAHLLLLIILPCALYIAIFVLLPYFVETRLEERGINTADLSWQLKMAVVGIAASVLAYRISAPDGSFLLLPFIVFTVSSGIALCNAAYLGMMGVPNVWAKHAPWLVVVTFLLGWSVSTDFSGEPRPTSANVAKAMGDPGEPRLELVGEQQYNSSPCMSAPSETIEFSMHLKDGMLVLADSSPIRRLLQSLESQISVTVNVREPAALAELVALERRKDFAEAWRKQVSETEVGLVRLATMLRGSNPGTCGTLAEYERRMITEMTEGAQSEDGRRILDELLERPSVVVISLDESKSSDALDVKERVKLSRLIRSNAKDAIVALRRHLGAGRTASPVAEDLALLILDRYLVLRADRLVSSLYGNVRIEDVDKMSEEWKVYIDEAIGRDFEQSVRLVEPSIAQSPSVTWFECGFDSLPGHPGNYGRFLLPAKAISGETSEQMGSGPWPVGSASEVIDPQIWARYAVWQMLARESGVWADGLSLFQEDMHSCGPP